MNPKEGKERPTLFSPEEIPASLHSNLHVITYDTSKQEINVMNPDEMTGQGVARLVDYAVRKGHGMPKVEEK